MSFVWQADQRLKSEEEVAREVHSVSLARGLDELATVLDIMCIRQESNFWSPANKKDPSSFNYAHDSESNDGRSVSYHQQQNGRAGDTLPPGDRDNWWGPMSCRMDLRCQTNTFLERLSEDYHLAKDNPIRAGQFVQNVQGSAFPDAYAKHWTYAWQLLQRALAETGGQVPVVDASKPDPQVPMPSSLQPNPGWRGDPVWMPDVLRAFGVDVYEVPGARERGHGDFGSIPYVLWHHTGSVNETDDGIAHHPALGLAANMLIHPDGKVAITGFGVAWHGGRGIYPGIPEDGINQISWGIECAYGPDQRGNYTIRWPDAQMEAMVKVGAAISWYLGNLCPPSHQIAHKEWAGADNPLGINKQGKPDPGNLDMNWFRGEIAKRAAAGPINALPPGEDSWMSDPTALQLLKDIHRETVTQKGPSRSFMATDGNNVDTPLGMIWNTDGNVWTLTVTESYWNDVPFAVQTVEDIARNGPAQTSWVASADGGEDDGFNEWLRKWGQAYCQGLVRRKAEWNRMVQAIGGPVGALTDPAAASPIPEA